MAFIHLQLLVDSKYQPTIPNNSCLSPDSSIFRHPHQYRLQSKLKIPSQQKGIHLYSATASSPHLIYEILRLKAMKLILFPVSSFNRVEKAFVSIGTEHIRASHFTITSKGALSFLVAKTMPRDNPPLQHYFSIETQLCHVPFHEGTVLTQASTVLNGCRRLRSAESCSSIPLLSVDEAENQGLSTTALSHS